MESADSLSIAVEEEHADATRDVVLAGLKAFNREHAQPPDFQRLTLSVRDAVGNILGGLTGETGWEWLHVELLWVALPFRGRGLGRRLLRRAEEEAARRDCKFAFLDTFDFHARPFYEREGYEVFGIQADYPPGHERFFLRKSLSGALR